MKQTTAEPKNEIIIYQPNETLRLEVRVDNESVWLTQSKIGALFGVDRTVINRHIRNVYRTGELEENVTCAKIAQVQNEGGREVDYFIRSSLPPKEKVFVEGKMLDAQSYPLTDCVVGQTDLSKSVRPT